MIKTSIVTWPNLFEKWIFIDGTGAYKKMTITHGRCELREAAIISYS